MHNPKTTKGKPRLLFFSLHTHVLPFTITEAVVGESVDRSRVQPVLMRPLRCTCKVNEHFGLWSASYSIKCVQCENNYSLVKKSLEGWGHELLSDYALAEDGDLVSLEMGSLTPNNVKDFTFQQIEVGKSAIHDIILKYKQDNLNFCQNDELWKEYRDLVRGCMLSILWLQRALREIQPKGLIVYNSNYSINRVASLLADRLGLPRFSIHGGASLSHTWDNLMLTRGDVEQYRLACCGNWTARFSQRILASEEVRKVGSHFDRLLEAKLAHVYSSPAGSSDCARLFPPIESNRKQKVILLALSSSDERFAIEQSGIREEFNEDAFVFYNQTDLLTFLIENVRRRKDLALIVRVHPRELPNKREGMTSSNSERLRGLLNNLPENIVVNWPDQNISFYDIIHHVDIILTAWSTVLLEASLFGAPIVLPFNPTRTYDVIAEAHCRTRDEYWNQVLCHLDKEWTLERSIRTFRWYWMAQFGGAVSLRSSRYRGANTKEKALQLLELGIQKIGRWRLGGIPVISDAFYGDYRQLVNRRVGVDGANTIRQTLLGEFDPMDDFLKLQQMQGARDGIFRDIANPDEERKAVLDELLRLTSTYRSAASSSTRERSSKILAMLDREAAGWKSATPL